MIVRKRVVVLIVVIVESIHAIAEYLLPLLHQFA